MTSTWSPAGPDAIGRVRKRPDLALAVSSLTGSSEERRPSCRSRRPSSGRNCEGMGIAAGERVITASSEPADEVRRELRRNPGCVLRKRALGHLCPHEPGGEEERGDPGGSPRAVPIPTSAIGLSAGGHGTFDEGGGNRARPRVDRTPVAEVA